MADSSAVPAAEPIDVAAAVQPPEPAADGQPAMEVPAAAALAAAVEVPIPEEEQDPWVNGQDPWTGSGHVEESVGVAGSSGSNGNGSLSGPSVPVAVSNANQMGSQPTSMASEGIGMNMTAPAHATNTHVPPMPQGMPVSFSATSWCTTPGTSSEWRSRRECWPSAITDGSTTHSCKHAFHGV